MNITVTRTISMGHRLKDYKGICSSPHGHNIKVRLTVKTIGEDALDFVDFKDVDKFLEKELEDFDHAMVLEEGDPLIETLFQFGFRLVVLNYSPTTENIAQYIFDQASQVYKVECVTVNETDKYSAQAYKRGNKVARVDL